MSDDKTKDTKKNEIGSSTNSQSSSKIKGVTSNTEAGQAKVISISKLNEKKKLELINQIIKTTPSF